MKNTFTFLTFFIGLLFFASCARKEHFSFSNSAQTSYGSVKKQIDSLVVVSAIETSSVNVLAEIPQSASEAPIYTASIDPHSIPTAAVFTRKKLLNDFNSLISTKPTVGSLAKVLKQQVKIIKAEKAGLKNKSTVADGDKKPNTLATVGLILGSLGIVALIVASATQVGIFSLISLLAAIGGLITSKMGLSEIKSSAGSETGKGKAVAGLIMSIAILALFLIGIILILTLLNNFS